ncbi:TetR/AcrR family transcriptional regulator [Mycobacterium yunnanensis]|uniref:TetR/AcrR family transcriptional regulator n=1 Tax=Mycobacterium yunnanensis TaxID=368477 RepID=A0A9X3C2H0_9MYCO|nr:TetR/AcrR family transcriptional regulator [Mycobacterium yunnanensis]MCV7420292.1 TetR/AcrR family transcriptional regulator [Mycobacterium yunnanensis]
MTEPQTSTRDRILAAATAVAQTRGYGGLSYRDLAREVGIKAASIYHYFPAKADLGAAVARRYWEDAAARLDELSAENDDAVDALSRYPETFRRALENDNRMCLCSYMAAEYDDLPDPVKHEVQTFTDVNVTWLAKMLSAAPTTASDQNEARARAIFAAIAGAQLVARSRSDIALYDALVDGYREAGLLPSS